MLFPKENTSGKIANTALLFMAAGLLLLAVTRAITIPLTHDEALSLSKFAVKPISAVFSYEDAGGLPNNHIVNTLWMKFASATIGESTLALRMGNLIGLLLFLYAALRLLFNVQSPALRIGGFLLLCCNPFVFDFFSLARGYGISNGFLLLSVWFLYAYRERPSPVQSTKLFSAAVVMVLANLNAVHVFAALALVVFAINLHHAKPLSAAAVFKSALAPFTASVVLGALLYLPFTEIIKAGGTFGGENGYWTDCVSELIASSTYGASYAFVAADVAAYTVVALLIAMPLAAVYRIVKNQNGFLAGVVALLVLPAVTTLVQHEIFHSEFPVARTLLYLHVLFVAALIAFAQTGTRAKAIAGGAVLTCGLFMLAHFAIAMQHNYAIQWTYDSDNRKVLDELEKRKAASQQDSLHVGITWFYEPGLNYERKQRACPWLQPFTQEGVSGEYDYFYVSPEDSLMLSERGKKVIVYYPESRSSLMK